MCEICRRNPCHPNCPNADPPKIIGHCEQCGCGLAADETYFTDSESNAFCSRDCALDYYGIEEAEFDDGL